MLFNVTMNKQVYDFVLFSQNGKKSTTWVTNCQDDHALYDTHWVSIKNITTTPYIDQAQRNVSFSSLMGRVSLLAIDCNKCSAF